MFDRLMFVWITLSRKIFSSSDERAIFWYRFSNRMTTPLETEEGEK